MFKRLWAYLVYRFKPVKTEFSYGGGMAEYSQRDLDRQAGITKCWCCGTVTPDDDPHLNFDNCRSSVGR